MYTYIHTTPYPNIKTFTLCSSPIEVELKEKRLNCLEVTITKVHKTTITVNLSNGSSVTEEPPLPQLGPPASSSSTLAQPLPTLIKPSPVVDHVAVSESLTTPAVVSSHSDVLPTPTYHFGQPVQPYQFNAAALTAHTNIPSASNMNPLLLYNQPGNSSFSFGSSSTTMNSTVPQMVPQLGSRARLPRVPRAVTTSAQPIQPPQQTSAAILLPTSDSPSFKIIDVAVRSSIQ